MISPSEIQAQDHIGKIRTRCLLPYKAPTRSEWMEAHKDRPLWWRLKFAPPAKD